MVAQAGRLITLFTLQYGSTRNMFWKLLAESVIVQALVTLTLVVVCCYLAIKGQPIPEELKGATLLALGFYFGSKSQQYIHASEKVEG
jgi:uncharacterized membrane-anchored protein